MREKLTKYLRELRSDKRRNFIRKLLFLAYSTYKKLDNKLSKQNNKVVSKLYIRLKNVERQFKSKCTFLTLEELLVWTNEWIKTFPETYDIIVGVPRSGLLIANIIALKLGKPLSTPELFRDGKYWTSENIAKAMGEKKEFYNVLLVDDCLRQEKTIEEPARILRSSNSNIKITKASLLISEEAVSYVDMYYKILHDYPPIGEWNLLHWKRGTLAVDLDGVICEDCPVDIDLDEKLYVEWIKNARPYLIPVFEIDYIVSSRLERYRAATEEWLARHRVLYNTLILWDIPTKEERKARFAEHKSAALLKIKPSVYWESSYSQAKKIWESTRIPTICIDEMIAFGIIVK